MSEGKPRGEFELIATYFAPLAKGAPGAFGLTDDAALLKPKAGHDIVATTDAIVAGVHFFADDPPDTIAQKALRVNVSDLAAKGAIPRAYLLTAVLPKNTAESWLKAFAEGLKRDQKRFGITLIGGDTVATPGPLTLNVAAFGDVPKGAMLRRSGAKAGDDVWVTGTLGDAALGLKILKGDDLGLSEGHREALVARYRVPEPRPGLGRAIRQIAHACLDVSDGLVADLGHIAEQSRAAIRIDAEAAPLSTAARLAIASGRATLTEILTGGDDYELAFTAPPSARNRLGAIAAKEKVALTRVGQVVKGKGVTVVAADGKVLTVSRAGFRHF